MIKMLKNPDILDQKPDLKLTPNYYHFISSAPRVWKSKDWGTAYSNNRGWYTRVPKEVK